MLTILSLLGTTDAHTGRSSDDCCVVSAQVMWPDFIDSLTSDDEAEELEEAIVVD